MRRGGIGPLLAALIVLFTAVAGVLVFLLIESDPFAPEGGDALPYGDLGILQFNDPDATPAPLVLGAASATEAPTEAPAELGGAEGEDGEPASGEPQPTEASDGAGAVGGNRLMPTPMPGDYFLPVLDRALRTPDDRAMIAVTVDGCDDSDKLTQILNTAARYDAKLTLFPTGDALMTLSSGFRTSVNMLGHELENISFDAGKKDYALSSGELALQLWRQSIAASYAMDRDYQQHFYRPSSPQSAGDQRTHFFIRKLGLLGVASYTYSYKGHSLDFLVDSLENGNIYQFDMSDASMMIFEAFLNAANRKGYKLVTMNELFGLQANEQGDALTLDQQTLPDMDDYVPTYYDLRLNDRTNAVYALQARLIALGYLTAAPGENAVADGIYGADTSVAVSEFQARVGLIATGNADVATQQRLFADDAPSR